VPGGNDADGDPQGRDSKGGDNVTGASIPLIAAQKGRRNRFSEREKNIRAQAYVIGQTELVSAVTALHGTLGTSQNFNITRRSCTTSFVSSLVVTHS